MNFFDYTTYCASPMCKNKCGKMMTDERKMQAIDSQEYLAVGYYCDHDGLHIKKFPWKKLFNVVFISLEVLSIIALLYLLFAIDYVLH